MNPLTELEITLQNKIDENITYDEKVHYFLEKMFTVDPSEQDTVLLYALSFVDDDEHFIYRLTLEAQERGKL